MKKIIIFIMSCLFIVGLAPASSAMANSTATTADDIKYRDIEDFMHSAGFTSFSKVDNAVYVVFNHGGYFYVYEFNGVKDQNPYFCYFPSSSYRRCVVLADTSNSYNSVIRYQYYDYNNSSKNDNYQCLGKQVATSNLYEKLSVKYKDIAGSWVYLTSEYRSYVHPNNIIYSDLDLYETEYSSNFYYDTSKLLFQSTMSDVYTFPAWCNDANLNALASTNESPTKIPYSYNDYWHIVRKTANGKWLLTTIGNSVMQENITDYTMMLTDDGNLAVFNLYSGEDYNGYILNVRQYEYDTDGWKVRTYETFNAQDDDDCIIDLGAGSGFDQTRILAYTNIDIYDEGFNVVHPASMEYYEVTTTPPTEEPDSLTPIPTTVPDNDSSGVGRPGSGSRPDTGGQAKPGGMLDFIITFFTLVWTKLFAVEVPVDGYNISFQAIVIFGVIAGVLIWLGKSSFGKKG